VKITSCKKRRICETWGYGSHYEDGCLLGYDSI